MKCFSALIGALAAKNPLQKISWKGTQLLVSTLAITWSVFLFPTAASAATKYWVGTAGGNINAASSWSTSAVATCGTSNTTTPGASDIATFGTGCTNSATINTAWSVQGVNMLSGYTGTVTQSTGITLTVGTSDFIMAGGTFAGGNSAIDISTGNFTISGGSFTATSGTMTIGKSFTKTNSPSFTHNSGTVTFGGTTNGSTSIDASGFTFNLVIINRTVSNSSNYTMTVTAGTTIPLGNSPTITLVNNGSGNFSLTNNGTITAGSGTWTITAGTITNNGTISSASMTTLTANAQFVNNSAISFLSATLLDFNTNGTDANGGYTNAASSSLITAATPTINVNDSLVVTNGTTFPSDATVNMDGTLAANTSLNAPGVTFTQVNINRTINNSSAFTLTIAASTTVPIGANPTVLLDNSGNGSYNLTNNGTITIQGTGTWTMTMGTFTNNATVSSSTITTWTVNADIVNTSSISLTALTTLDVNQNGGDANGGYTNSNGSSLTTASNPAISVNENLIVNSGTTFPTNATVTFDGTYNVATTKIDATGVSFAQVIINRTVNNGNNVSFRIISGTTAPLGNDPTTVFNNTGLGNMNITNEGTITVGTGTWTLVTQTLTNNGTINANSVTTWAVSGDISNPSGKTINMTSATLIELNANGTSRGTFTNGATGIFNNSLNPVVNIAGDFTVPSGSTFPTSITATFDGTSGTQTITAPNITYLSLTKNQSSSLTLGHSITVGDFTFSDGGTINNPGTARSMFISGSFAMSTSGTLGGSNLTVEFNGSGLSTITKTNGTFSSLLRINKTGSGEARLNSAFATTGASATTTVAAGKFHLNGQTFTSAGTFTVQNGATLKLIGSESPTTPTLSAGSTVNYIGTVGPYVVKQWSYRNLSITGSGGTFQFTAAATYTVAEAMNFSGANGNKITLRSTVSGSQWKLDPQSTRTAQYLDVKDSNNLTLPAIDCTFCTNSLNNINWNFPGAVIRKMSTFFFMN